MVQLLYVELMCLWDAEGHIDRRTCLFWLFSKSSLNLQTAQSLFLTKAGHFANFSLKADEDLVFGREGNLLIISARIGSVVLLSFGYLVLLFRRYK